MLFLTHGEADERAALRKAALGLGLASDQIIAPQLDDRVALQAGGTSRIVETGTERIEPSQIGHDWHNGYAELMISLSDALRAAQSDSEREAMIERLKTALAAE